VEGKRPAWPMYGALRRVVSGDEERFWPGWGRAWKEESEP